jgi:Ca-activated chloride channel family protein
MGIGTSSGQPIPVRDEQGATSGYKKDENGEVVVSRLDENSLQEIAGVTGGKYYLATAGESEVDDVRQEIDRLDKRELESKVVRNYEERFQYFLAAGMILLMAEMLLRKS